ncbi:hypothetical protein, partial [Pseudomonas silesiensis]|uniref:hypothetical protein n=1 Tax=Pseudomonas silesiensis TaxID=1853130 RepID=UPI0034D6C022
MKKLRSGIRFWRGFFCFGIRHFEALQGLLSSTDNCFYIEGLGFALLSRENVPFCGLRQVIARKAELKVDGRFWKSIIRPTSGAVETENSLVN